MYTSDRIRMRFPEHNEIHYFKTWYDDAIVREHLNHSFPMSIANETKWFESMIRLPLRAQNFFIETRVNDTWQVIGTCVLRDVNQVVGCAELGIVIGEKAFWGHGLGTEAVRLLLRHGFQHLNLHRIQLRVFANHPGAIKCYQKAGMKEEARLRDASYKNGVYVDVLLFGLLQIDWNKRERDD